MNKIKPSILLVNPSLGTPRYADEDHKESGLDLDRRLRALDELKLNRYLAQIDGGISPESLAHTKMLDQKISAFGIGFSVIENAALGVDLK